MMGESSQEPPAREPLSVVVPLPQGPGRARGESGGMPTHSWTVPAMSQAP